MIDGAASLRAEHSAGVCVVHHHDAAELVCYVTKTGQRAQVAVHAEHAVGDEQRSLAAGNVREDRAGRRDVAVGKHFDRRATQASAVDDAGVIQLVGNDDVVATEERRDGTGIRCEATLEDHGGFCFLNVASRRSSSMWICIVPAIVRTEPVPTPSAESASSAR